MSRIGKQPIKLPADVTVTQDKDQLFIKGPGGEINHHIFKELSVDLNDQQVIIKSKNDEDKTKALHGLLRSLVSNAVEGVSQGFEKRLELVGTGYRVKKEGENLVFSLGFSHPIIIEPIKGITFELEGEKEVIIKGIDKQQVGQVAANIRSFRKPEPYKGKGVRYKDEIVRRKAGKAAKTGSAGGA